MARDQRFLSPLPPSTPWKERLLFGADMARSGLGWEDIDHITKIGEAIAREFTRKYGGKTSRRRPKVQVRS